MNSPNPGAVTTTEKCGVDMALSQYVVVLLFPCCSQLLFLAVAHVQVQDQPGVLSRI